jgi:hypothetical protein
MAQEGDVMALGIDPTGRVNRLKFLLQRRSRDVQLSPRALKRSLERGHCFTQSVVFSDLPGVLKPYLEHVHCFTKSVEFLECSRV